MLISKMEGFRYLANDLLLYFSTSLVFSITCLCILLQIKAKDRYSRDFLKLKKNYGSVIFGVLASTLVQLEMDFNEEIIKKYIRNQEHNKNKAESRIKQLTLFPFLDKKLDNDAT